VVDGTKRTGMLASLYQRGLTFDEAVKTHEWMYINFWNKAKADEKVTTLDGLLEYQEAYLKDGFSDVDIQFLDGVRGQKKGAKTLIRRMKNDKYPVPEYTGFVDFDKFVFMCVLFTPEHLERKNLRKLRFVLREAFPMTVIHDAGAKEPAGEKRDEG
jgi:hypothetical protein